MRWWPNSLTGCVRVGQIGPFYWRRTILVNNFQPHKHINFHSAHTCKCVGFTIKIIADPTFVKGVQKLLWKKWRTNRIIEKRIYSASSSGQTLKTYKSADNQNGLGIARGTIGWPINVLEMTITS